MFAMAVSPQHLSIFVGIKPSSSGQSSVECGGYAGLT
jgi:hypothetical protein